MSAPLSASLLIVLQLVMSYCERLLDIVSVLAPGNVRTATVD